LTACKVQTQDGQPDARAAALLAPLPLRHCAFVPGRASTCSVGPCLAGAFSMLSGGAAAGVVPSLRGVSSPAACCQGLVSPTMDRICSAALRLRALRGSDTGPSVAAAVVGAPPASNVAAAAAGDASPPRRASAGDLFQNVPGTEVVALASSDAGPGSPGARLVAAAIAARGLILVSTVRRCGAPLPSVQLGAVARQPRSLTLSTSCPFPPTAITAESVGQTLLYSRLDGRRPRARQRRTPRGARSDGVRAVVRWAHALEARDAAVPLANDEAFDVCTDSSLPCPSVLHQIVSRVLLAR
jgi:hypothetical protein